MDSTKTLTMINVEPGASIAGRYEVREQIGSGGMGHVLRVHDRQLDEEVALKLLHPHLASDDIAFKRFMNEVRVARTLTHPNIVRLHDIGEAPEGFSYISMEFVPGCSLREHITERGGLALEEAYPILYQILAGVGYAHGKGVVHRDLKPANVLLSDQGEVKIADFGTARILGMDTSLTQTGQSIGTPDYMSPEQIRGEHLDSACDIYALGIMFFEVIVGARPHSADSPVAVAFKHLNEPIPDNGALPDWYQELVEKACAKDRGERFFSVIEMANILVDHAPELGSNKTIFSAGMTHFRSALDSSIEIPQVEDQTSSQRGWRLNAEDLEEEQTTVDETPPAVRKVRFGAVAVGFILLFGALLAMPRISPEIGASVKTFLGEQFGDSAQGLYAILGLPEDEAVDERVLLERELLTDDPELALEAELERAVESAEKTELVEKSPEAFSVESGKSQVSESQQVAEELVAEQKPVEETPSEVSEKEEEPTVPEKNTRASEKAEVSEESLELEKTIPEEIPIVLAAELSFTRPGINGSVSGLSLTRLPQARWKAQLKGFPDAQKTSRQKGLLKEFHLNVFNPEQGKVVGRLDPSGSARVISDAVVLSGSMRSLRRSTLTPGNYRFDLVRNGEVLVSEELSLYMAKVQTPAVEIAGEKITQFRLPQGASEYAGYVLPGPSAEKSEVSAMPSDIGGVVVSGELPPARRLNSYPGSSLGEKKQDSSAEIPTSDTYSDEKALPKESYSGALELATNDERAMILELAFQEDGTIRGEANIAGVGDFRVQGRVYPRGIELILKSSDKTVRLTGAKRAGSLRGRFYIPQDQQRGPWDAKLLN